MEGFYGGYTSPISDTFWFISTVGSDFSSSMMGDGSFFIYEGSSQNAEAMCVLESTTQLSRGRAKTSVLWF